jgi:hypothetical protein
MARAWASSNWSFRLSSVRLGLSMDVLIER